MTVETEVALGSREADEHARVDLGSEHGRIEDAGEVEPHAAEPDPLAGVETLDPQPLRRRGTEHCDGLASGSGVQVAAGGDSGTDRLRQAEARRLHREGIRVDRRDERAAVDVDGRRAGVLDLLDGTDAGDHAGGRERQLGCLPEEGLAVRDGEQVGTELVDLRQQARLTGRGEPENRDDGGDADRDPERGEGGADPAGAETDAGNAGEIGES